MFTYILKSASIHSYSGSIRCMESSPGILYVNWYLKSVPALENKNVECMEWRGDESNQKSILWLYFAKSLMPY